MLERPKGRARDVHTYLPPFGLGVAAAAGKARAALLETMRRCCWGNGCGGSRSSERRRQEEDRGVGAVADVVVAAPPRFDAAAAAAAAAAPGLARRRIPATTSARRMPAIGLGWRFSGWLCVFALAFLAPSSHIAWSISIFSSSRSIARERTIKWHKLKPPAPYLLKRMSQEEKDKCLAEHEQLVVAMRRDIHKGLNEGAG